MNSRLGRLLSIAMIALFLLSAGCIHEIGTARLTDDDALARIHPGQTTRYEIRSYFGEPAIGATATVEGEELETWVYVYLKTQTRPSAFNIPLESHGWNARESKTRSLTIQFGRDGLVRNMGRGGVTRARVPIERILQSSESAEEAALNKVKVGVTTAEETRSLLGEPADRLKDVTGGEPVDIWVYLYDGTDDRPGYSVTVVLGRDGLVKSVERLDMVWG